MEARSLRVTPSLPEIIQLHVAYGGRAMWQPDSFRTESNRASTFNCSRDTLGSAADLMISCGPTSDQTHGERRADHRRNDRPEPFIR